MGGPGRGGSPGTVVPLDAGPRRRRLDSDERRAEILAAAARLFSERPYSAVSTADLAAAAGVTRGLLHHYFGSKRELYLATVRRLVRGATVPLPRVRGGSHDRALWERSVDTWLDLVEANREMWFVAIGAGETGRDRELHDILDEARERTATRVLEVLGLDRDAGPELRAVIRAYGRLAEETTREWLERRRLTREQARVLLVGSLPLVVEQVLPSMLAAPERARAGETGR